MRKDLIAQDELLGQLRQQGITDFGQVKEAHVEEDGKISVIPR